MKYLCVRVVKNTLWVCEFFDIIFNENYHNHQRWSSIKKKLNIIFISYSNYRSLSKQNSKSKLTFIINFHLFFRNNTISESKIPNLQPTKHRVEKKHDLDNNLTHAIEHTTHLKFEKNPGTYFSEITHSIMLIPSLAAPFNSSRCSFERWPPSWPRPPRQSRDLIGRRMQMAAAREWPPANGRPRPTWPRRVPIWNARRWRAPVGSHASPRDRDGEVENGGHGVGDGDGCVGNGLSCSFLGVVCADFCRGAAFLIWLEGFFEFGFRVFR